MSAALWSAGHILFLMLLVSTLVLELVLLRPALLRHAVGWLSRVDLLYFLAALGMLGTGAMRLTLAPELGGKGSAYYLAHGLFHAKMGLFVLIALLSLPPTFRFLRWAKAAKANPGFMPSEDERRSVRRWLILEVHLLLALPVLAALVARGVGS